MIHAELKKLANKADFLDLYSQGIDSLKASGIFEALKLMGQPTLVFDGKDPHALAAQAARSVGWNSAINALLNFETLLLAALDPKKNPELTFSGLEKAVSRGDLLKEEADAIRRGTKPDPSIYKPANVPTERPGTHREKDFT